MSLWEPSVDQVKKHGPLTLMDPTMDFGEQQLRGGFADMGEKPVFLRSPSSLQDMLKNTTETGDVGQFPAKPSRIPQLFHRTTPLSTTGAMCGASKGNLAKQHHTSPGDLHHGFLPSYSMSSASSSVISLYHTRSQHSYRTSSRGLATTQNAYSNRSFSNPNLQLARRTQGRADLRDTRPSSPFVYPTRLKRPGYWPCSPADSDVKRPFKKTSRNGHIGDQIRNYPHAAAHAMRGSHQPRQKNYQQDFSYRWHPQSPETSNPRTRPSSPYSIRVVTPGPPMCLDQNVLSSQGSPAPNSIRSGWSKRSLSPSPVFYDYTEAFEEENRFRISVVSLTGHGISETPNKIYHELDGNSIGASLHELPTHDEPSKEDVQERKRGTTSASVAERTSTGQSQSFAVKSTEAVSDTGSINEDSIHSRDHDQFRRYDEDQSFHKQCHVSRDMRYHEASVDTSWPQQSAINISSRSTYPSRSSVTSMHRSLSSTESMYSVQSSAPLEKSALDLQKQDSIEVISNEIQPKGPSVGQSQPNSPVGKNALSRVLLTPRALSFDCWAENEHPQIYTPIPERSRSSPSHRGRFSHIFSIGQGSLEIDNTDTSRESVTGFERVMKSNLLSNLNPEIDHRLINKPKAYIANGQTLVRPGPEEELERFDAISDTLSKVKAMRTQNQLSESDLEQVNAPSVSPDPHTSLRISVTRKPISNLSGSPIHRSFKDIEATHDLSRNSTPVYHLTTFEEHKNARHTIANLSSIPSMASLRSCSPPAEPTRSESLLPPSPLLSSEQDFGHAHIKTPLDQIEDASNDEKNQVSSQKFKLKMRSDENSWESSSSSRPWNLDTSYPWTDQHPELNVTVPGLTEDPVRSESKPPRFKLRIHRASSFTGKARLMRSPPTPDPSGSRKNSISGEYFRSGPFTRKSKPSTVINQNNSSHTGPVTARFSENISSSAAHSASTPQINLVPPSPGLNLEVQSFFSDDSEQAPAPKGTLRKRISRLKAMASRTNLREESEHVDRGRLSSAMGTSSASQRIEQEEGVTSRGIHALKQTKSKIAHKVKDWLHRGEEKVQGWKLKKTTREPEEGPISTTVYPGT